MFTAQLSCPQARQLVYAVEAKVNVIPLFTSSDWEQAAWADWTGACRQERDTEEAIKKVAIALASILVLMTRSISEEAREKLSHDRQLLRKLDVALSRKRVTSAAPDVVLGAIEHEKKKTFQRLFLAGKEDSSLTALLSKHMSWLSLYEHQART